MCEGGETRVHIPHLWGRRHVLPGKPLMTQFLVATRMHTHTVASFDAMSPLIIESRTKPDSFSPTITGACRQRRNTYRVPGCI
jgi:hypothetical protein